MKTFIITFRPKYEVDTHTMEIEAYNFAEAGGDLIPFNFADHTRTAVTPKGIEIYEPKQL